MEVISVAEAEEAPAKSLFNFQIPFVTTIVNHRTFRKVKRWLPVWRWDFPTIHGLIFITWSVFCMVLMLVSSTDTWVNPIDSLFFAVSSITLTGLAPMNVSSLSLFQQIVLFLNFNVGSPITTSIAVTSFRIDIMKDVYRVKIGDRRRAKEQVSEDVLLAELKPSDSPQFDFEESLLGTIMTPHNPELISSHGLQTKFNRSFNRANWTLYWKEFLSNNTVGRNSAFHGLTQEERASIAFIEYNSVRLVRLVVFLYSLGLQFIGAIILAIYFASCKGKFIYERGVNPWWLGIFCSASAFNNAGMSVMDDSMMSFKTSAVPVATISFLMFAGNTGFPILLRFVLWVMLKLLPKASKYDNKRAVITYILKYPRRVYTHLFGSEVTWLLFIMLFVLNCIDFVAFELSTMNNVEVKDLPIGYRVLVGLFQALSVRCSGFNIVSISNLSSGLLCLYNCMMYISAYPVTITMRGSNVYEERSLGIYSDDISSAQDDSDQIIDNHKKGRTFFIKQQLQSQLGYDVLPLTLALTVVTFIESHGAPVPLYSVFSVGFEVVSAYCNIGLTVGLPDQSYALSGSWSTASKFCMCLLMLRGRHRSLPVGIDPAVQLTLADVASGEEDDEQEREHERERLKKFQ